MVAALAGDDFFLLGLADQIVVMPYQFGLGFVGVGAGETIKDFFHVVRRQVDEAL